MRTLAWDEMRWLNEPPHAAVVDGVLAVETAARTDFWQRTSYGFVHDDGHFLGAPFPSAGAVEVTFRGRYEARFDQAGLMLRAGPEVWLKTGIELSDGQLWASVVATDGVSDWSVAPLPSEAATAALTFRASRRGDGVTVRYRIGADADWTLLRVAPMSPEARLLAGPMCCSPTRAGLSVRFDSVRMGPPDDRLHD